jgi:hypothetical protein
MGAVAFDCGYKNMDEGKEKKEREYEREKKM